MEKLSKQIHFIEVGFSSEEIAQQIAQLDGIQALDSKLPRAT